MVVSQVTPARRPTTISGTTSTDSPGSSAKANVPKHTSPVPGSPTSLRTSARLDGDSWVIDGAKQWVSSATGWNGDGADLICVVCRTDPVAPPESAISVIAVPGPARGISIERLSDSMGHRAHLTPRFKLDQVRVPKANVLGSVGGGMGLVEASFAGTASAQLRDHGFRRRST